MSFISRYPILDVYHVGVTSMRPPDVNFTPPSYYYGYLAFNPSTQLINNASSNSWISYPLERHNQRIWADLGTPYIITRLYYENYHNCQPPDTFNPALITGDMNEGAYEGSIWGSNIQPEAYGTYTELTKLWEGKFIRHNNLNASDPQYIVLSNSTPFQYYIIDINNNYSGNFGIGFRRLEFQEDIPDSSSSLSESSSSSTEIKSSSSSSSHSSSISSSSLSSISVSESSSSSSSESNH